MAFRSRFAFPLVHRSDGVEQEVSALAIEGLLKVPQSVCGVWSPLALLADCSVYGYVRLVVGL
jgi:hypothetical protein